MPELPFEIWKERIENEIKILKNLNFIENDTIVFHEKNVDFWVNINSLGFVTKDNTEKLSLLQINSHRIFIKLNRSFPYPGGIDLSWYSNIFHPNIHPVEIQNSEKQGTGYICLNILKQWSRLSDLESTVKSLQKLVENPNPDDPLNYDICTKAAEFFKKHPMEEFRKNHNNGEEIEEEKDDEDVIIVED
jgi:ubiquitin-protein ligase